MSVRRNLPFVATYQAAATLEALGDPTRRAIFELLGEGRPRPVGEIAARVPLSRPPVSQPLKVLKTAGLVVDHAVGTRRLYRLDPRGVDAMRDYFEKFWTRALTAFKEYAEK